MWVLLALLLGTIAIVAVVATLTIRSLNRWKQPPPGKDLTAHRAESFLSWITRTRGDMG